MGTSSAESVDCLRQKIDDEINSLQASIMTLKFRRNALAPISRLPPEILASIFSLLPFSSWNKQVGHLARIRVTHVCSRWREIALNYPRVWSYINFDKLSAAGVDGMFAWTKMAPLNLEADVTEMNKERFDVFKRQLEAHISHTRHLCIFGHLTRGGLVSSAPILRFLSLSHFVHFKAVVPFKIFNGPTPSLTSLELENYNISWKSHLLKGLRTLKIENVEASAGSRPNLEDWLDALDQMPQLETLVLRYASPSAPRDAPLTSEPSRRSRTIAFPSLTEFRIDASAKDCGRSRSSRVARSHLAIRRCRLC